MALHDISSISWVHWQIHPENTIIEFAVGRSPLHRVRGRFHGVRGWVETSRDHKIDPVAQIEIDAAGIDTGIAIRDRHLRTGQFLAVKHFPTISFTGMSVEDLGHDRLRVFGDLTIRGITRQIVLDAKVEQRDGEQAVVSASTMLDRRDFKIGPSAMGLVVGNDVAVRITLGLLLMNRNPTGPASSHINPISEEGCIDACD